MAVKACNTKVLVDEFDFSGESSGVVLDGTVNAITYNVLQTCADLVIPTSPALALQHNGYYTGPDAGKLERELYDRLGTSSAVYVAALFGTGGTVVPAYVMDQTWGQQLKLEMPVDGLLTVNGNWPNGNEAVHRGYVVYDGTLSATGGQASVDFGAQGTAGGRAYVFVQSITGTASGATIDIESSADDSTFLVEGTATFSAVGVQVVNLTGTVDRYIRANCTSLGGATSFRVVVIVAISGVTY